MSPRIHWIVTADHRHATLFALTTTPGGAWHAEERRAIQSTHENEHEHHRPSLLARGPRPNESERFASWGHEVEEEHRRFARETAEWLSATMTHVDADHVHLFAAPRALGLLREEVSRLTDHAHLTPRLTLHEAELTHLRPGELATHPAVVASLGTPQKAGPIIL